MAKQIEQVPRFRTLYNYHVGQHYRSYVDLESHSLQTPSNPFACVSADDFLRLNSEKLQFDSSDEGEFDINPQSQILQSEEIPSPHQQDYTKLQREVEKEIKELEEKEKKQQETENKPNS